MSIRPSKVSSLKSFVKYSIPLLNWSPRLVERGTYDGFPCFSLKSERRLFHLRGCSGHGCLVAVKVPQFPLDLIENLAAKVQ